MSNQRYTPEFKEEAVRKVLEKRHAGAAGVPQPITDGSAAFQRTRPRHGALSTGSIVQ